MNQMPIFTKNPDQIQKSLNDTLFETEDEMTEAFSGLYRGDLYLIGRLWIEAMKTVLVGSNISLFPVVKASHPPEPPKKPPLMRYKDLSIYQSPHYEYKEYVEGLDKCPDYKVKLLHNYLLPYVTDARKQIQKTYSEAKCTIKGTCKNTCNSIHASKQDFKKQMRDPKNIMVRRGVVASTAGIGYILAQGKGLPTRIFCTTLGAFTGGALCFPKESDEAFRTVMYHTAKSFICFYNCLSGKGCTFRERVPCTTDLPKLPNQKRPEQCPQK